MHYIKTYSVVVVLILSTLVSFKPAPPTVIRNDFKKFYDQFKVQGSFILYDQNNRQYTIHNQEQISKSFTPASTFKICNSLIALETGIVKDEHVVFKWDGTERQIPAWNKDTDMEQAFKNSTV